MSARVIKAELSTLLRMAAREKKANGKTKRYKAMMKDAGELLAQLNKARKR